MASGFYEWHLDEAGQRFPYFMHLADTEHFAYEAWLTGTMDEARVVLKQYPGCGGNP